MTGAITSYAITGATNNYFPALQKPYISKIPDAQCHQKPPGSICQCHVKDIFLDIDTMELHSLHNFEEREKSN